MRIRTLFFAAGLAALASPVLADAGVPPVWSDFQPAVSTQYRPPDGGKAYPPPDTKTLLRPEDRRASERAEAELNRKAAAPLPGRATDAAKPARKMKDPLALPPATPSMPITAPQVETNPTAR